MADKTKTHAEGMGRKKKRGEASVPRHKLKSKLVYTDREGEIAGPTKRELAKAIEQQNREYTNSLPFKLEPNNSKPDNVTCITEARTKREEKAEHSTVCPVKAPHGWLHDKALATSEFKMWKARAAQGNNAQGKLWHEQWLEKQRLLADNGHSKSGVTPINKAAQDKDSEPVPVSVVHNPGISPKPILDKSKLPANDSYKPLDPKFWNPAAIKTEPLAPSGLPMRMFLEGGKYAPPKQSSVEYSNDWTPKGSRKSAKELTNLHKTSHEEWKLVNMLQWFAATVEVQFWNRLLYEYIEVRDNDEYIVQTGAVNKEINTGNERLITRAIIDSLRTYIAWSDDEVKASQAERRLLEWELGWRMENDSPDTKHVSKSLTAAHKDRDTLLFEYRIHLSQLRSEGPERTFARYAYGDPSLGEEIKAALDAEKQHKAMLKRERFALKRIRYRVHKKAAATGFVKYPETQVFRQKAALYRIKHKVKLYQEKDRRIFYSRFKKQQELTFLRKRGAKVTTTSFIRKNVDYQKVINNVVGVRDVAYSAPYLIDFYKEIGVEHKPVMSQRWKAWAARRSYAGRLAATTFNVVQKVLDVLDTEVNPYERRRKAEKARQKAAARHSAKANKKKVSEQQATKAAARAAYRIAH